MPADLPARQPHAEPVDEREVAILPERGVAGSPALSPTILGTSSTAQ
jgi:hypothetical protein